MVAAYRRFVSHRGEEFSTRCQFYFLLTGILSFNIFVTIAFNNTLQSQQFTCVFYALFLCLLDDARMLDRSRIMFIFPPLMLIWVNLHGGFLYGFAAIGLYTVWATFEKRWNHARALLITLGLCSALTLVNPYGLIFHEQMVAGWLLSRPDIMEWKSVVDMGVDDFSIILNGLLIVAWIAVSGRIWMLTRKGFPGHFLLITATGLEGILHIK